MMNSSQPSFVGAEILAPDSIKEVRVCRVSGMRPTTYCNESSVDPDTGALRYFSTSYPEYLLKTEELGICPVHGSELKPPPPEPEGFTQETVNAIPIKAKAPLLLGFDPYNSETPTLGMKDEDANDWKRFNVLEVTDEVDGEAEALLSLPRPLRYELPLPGSQTAVDEDTE